MGNLTLTVAKRFCGPRASSNGGYFCGLVSALSQDVRTVRLMKPPPLDTSLDVVEQPEGVLAIQHGEVVVGQSRPASLQLDPPVPPSYVESLDASLHYAGFKEHPYPTCFVCGTQRARGDGLRVFAGPVAGREIVAAPWVPDQSLDAGDGKVRPEFMFAAMDCPGCFAANKSGRGLWLLGEFTGHIDRRVHIDEPCRVIGWHIGSNGRKHEAGTALFDEEGELCGRAKAVWIEPASSPPPLR
jgi:hypothetical protein